MEYDSEIIGIVDHLVVEGSEPEAHVKASAAFPDMGDDLVHTGKQGRAVALLAIAGAAAAGADVGDEVLVQVRANRVITRGAEVDLDVLICGVLDVGRRDRHEVVGVGTQRGCVGVEVHQVVLAVDCNAVFVEEGSGGPGGEIRHGRQGPAPGLYRAEIDVPLVTGLRFRFEQVEACPVAGHTANAAAAATTVLVKDQHVPALGLDPAIGVDWHGTGLGETDVELVGAAAGIPAVHENVVGHVLFCFPREGGQATLSGPGTGIVVVEDSCEPSDCGSRAAAGIVADERADLVEIVVEREVGQRLRDSAIGVVVTVGHTDKDGIAHRGAILGVSGIPGGIVGRIARHLGGPP